METESINERKKLLKSVEEILEVPMIVLGFVCLIQLIFQLVRGVNKILEYVTIGI